MLLPRAIEARPALPVALRVPGVRIGRERLVILGLALFAAAAHGLNMPSYPAFTLVDDEGIYAAQALAFLRDGAMSPYTYSYDHAPGGWIQLGLFYALTGGPAAFGTPIDGGRVLMLLFHVGSAVLLYRVGRLLGASMLASAVAVVLFTVSPLATFFQRMLLLDNIMVFWLLASLVLLLGGRTWARIALSGLAFGVAALSKETAVLVLPVYAVLAWRALGWRATAVWLGALTLAVLPYPLYALSRGELWPVADPYLPYIAGSDPRARSSLISTLIWQVTRPGGGFWNLNNNFLWYLRHDWLWRDATFLVLGAGAAIANAVRGLRGDRRLLVPAACALLIGAYLGRGGVVFAFYIIVAIPFLALNVALAFDALARGLDPPRAVRLAGCLLVLLGGVYWWSGAIEPLYAQRPDTAGRDAAAWVKSHLPPDAKIIGRDDLFAYLREPIDGPGFAEYHIHWRVAHDPVTMANVFGYQWRSVDYLVISNSEEDDFWGTDNQIAIAARWNAHKIAEWESSTGESPFHPAQTISVWEADRLLDPDPAAYLSPDLRHGRDQLCGPRQASCEERKPTPLSFFSSPHRPD
ncbi:MAG TPA: phospholipid carrier-dependent glycosyltransferase [Candidatus Limnocylindria bacterium]